MMALLALIVLLLVFTGGALVAINVSQNRVAIAQAQAAIEQARAAQDAAKAAQIASAGQTALGIGQTIILILVLAALVGFAAVYVYLRFFRRAPAAETQVHALPSYQPPRISQPDNQQLLMQQMQQMNQLLMMEMLTQRRQALPPSPPTTWAEQ